MSFLNDIKNQPQHTREIMFGLAVFITILLIGMVWFRSFQRNLFVLMNPPEEVDRMLAVENVPVPSLFGFIWQSAGEFKGLVSGLFNSDANVVNEHANDANEEESGNVYTLPLSEYK